MTLGGPHQFKFVRQLCKHLSENELARADERIGAYFNLVRRIALTKNHGDSGFDKSAMAPQDSTRQEV